MQLERFPGQALPSGTVCDIPLVLPPGCPVNGKRSAFPFLLPFSRDSSRAPYSQVDRYLKAGCFSLDPWARRRSAEFRGELKKGAEDWARTRPGRRRSAFPNSVSASLRILGEQAVGVEAECSWGKREMKEAYRRGWPEASEESGREIGKNAAEGKSDSGCRS